MQLWVAGLLFLICAGGAVFFLFMRRKRKKLHYLILAALSLFLALAVFTYIGLTWIFVSSDSDSPDKNPKVAAAMMIDPFIDMAITAVDSAKRSDISAVTYPYEQVYEYDSLNAADKSMYDEMLTKAKSFAPFSYTAKEQGYDEMDRSLRIYGALAKDHPEIENYFYMKEVLDGDMTTAIKAQYMMPWDADMKEADIDELRYETALFDAVCERIVEKMPEGLSTYDKYRYLAAVISFVTSYDHDGAYCWQDATAYGSIVSGHSICQGYSRGFMVLCRKANLWCECVEGEFEGTAHGWNLVKLDTGTYHVDITWADEKGLPDSTEWERYFMLTQDEILADHEIYEDLAATGTPIAVYEKSN